jgi:tetratricopeptide (TPR) repeat protein
MKKTNKKLIIVLLALACFSISQKIFAESDFAFERVRQTMDEFEQLKSKGDFSYKNKNYQEAEIYYKQALDLVLNRPLEGVARGLLMRLYEEMGRYQEALSHLEWMLARVDKSEPNRAYYSQTKSRLLQKIEEQKSWEAKQDPVVPKFKNGFEQASPEKQREFLEGLGGPGIMDVFKEAMVAEHGGDFKRALGIYESLLPRKVDIEKEFGMDGWVMLYPAIQRNAEMLKDTPKEKEALIWMKENLLPGDARYHAALSKLMPQNVAHIEKRIKDYQL